MQVFVMRFALIVLMAAIITTAIPIYIIYRFNNNDIYEFSELNFISVAYIILIGGMSQPCIGIMWRFFDRRRMEFFDLSVLTITIIYIAIGVLMLAICFYYTMALKNFENIVDLIKISNDHPPIWITFVIWWLFGFLACLNIGVTGDRK